MRTWALIIVQSFEIRMNPPATPSTECVSHTFLCQDLPPRNRQRYHIIHSWTFRRHVASSIPSPAITAYVYTVHSAHCFQACAREDAALSCLCSSMRIVSVQTSMSICTAEPSPQLPFHWRPTSRGYPKPCWMQPLLSTQWNGGSGDCWLTNPAPGLGP